MQKISHLLYLSTLSLALTFSVRAGEYEGAINIQKRVDQFTGIQAYQPLTSLERSIGYQGSTQTAPWSGNYWPLYQGQIGYAYKDRQPRNARKKFSISLKRFEQRIRQVKNRIDRGRLSEGEIENLAPVEKYDLYLGDTNFTLTFAIWNSLKESDGGRDKKHHIKDWEGICHGWAAASAYSKRPTHKIEVKSVDGKYNIAFYPDDLKALSTLLWANSLVQDQTKMEGLRCKEGGVDRDDGTGKVLTTRCKGVNPGVFHLTTLGLVGQRRMPFIINKNNDEEIWNQPVIRYAFKYYNIQTGAEGSLQQSAIPIARAEDQFTKFRPQGTTSLVGVHMELSFADETDPSHEERNEASQDDIAKMDLKYDLELDANYNVLGGEWIDSDTKHDAGNAAYPGFMWRFKYDYPFASSIVDMKTPEPGTPKFNSSTLIQLNREASSFRYAKYQIDDEGDYDKTVFDEKGMPVLSHKELHPQPIAKIVNYLVNLSNQ